ncbi:MAG TPA: hypothetical protein VF836_04285 [Gemmatimonadaceae bacterium]
MDLRAMKTLQTLKVPGAARAHVSVDPRTHFVYLPLENVNGRPVFPIYEPMR